MPPPGTQPLAASAGRRRLRPRRAWWRPTSWREQGYRPLVLERGRAVRDRIRDVRAFDDGRPVRSGEQLSFRRGRRRHLQRRQADLPQHRPGRAPRAGTVRRVQGQAVDPLRRPAAPGQQPPAGRGQGDPPPRRGAGRRGALLLPRRGPRPAPTAGCAAWSTSSGYIPAVGGAAGDRPQRPRHLRNAAAPRRADGAEAVPDGRAHRAAAGDGQPRQVRPDAAWRSDWGRPTTRWWPTAGTTCSPSACAPAATSCRACPSRATSAPTA